MTNPVARLTASLADRYRLERELGQGGMATVYLAEDLKHGRKVAIKVLRPELSAILGSDRFLSEIKTTASLQHPHILGLIDSGEADGLLYYVMPFIEGETLRGRLTREKQLPVDDSIRLTKEVAAALEFAHKRGIIHRDIKPENILLQDGQALVADFGIALAVQQAGGSRMTQTGMSLGTPAYMSPEQAMGERDLGPRSDVYALGVMTYEMLLGETPFTGLSAQAVIAKALTDMPPPLRPQRPTVSPVVEHAVLTALQKLPADRFGSAREFADALDGKGGAVYASTVDMGATRPTRLTRLTRLTRPVTLAALALTAIAAAVAGWFQGRSRAPAPVARYGLAFPDSQVPRTLGGIAPDGSLVYIGPADVGTQVWAKERDRYEAAPIPGTVGAQDAVLSPDGKWVAFTVDNKLKKVQVAGGTITTLADSVADIGNAWLSDGSLVYSSLLHGRYALRRVPEAGGASSLAWESDTILRFPRLSTALPGARGVLFTLCVENCAASDLWVLDLESGAAKRLLPGVVRGWYLPSGHLVYVSRDGQMFAAEFSLRTLEIRTMPVPVLGRIVLGGGPLPMIVMSSGGTVVMQPGGVLGGPQDSYELAWVDRAGIRTPVDTTWTFYLSQTGGNVGWGLSPDGSRLAIGLNTTSGDDIWIKQLPAGPLSRLTVDTVSEQRPRWSPDGRFVTYLVNETAMHALRQRRADGTGSEETLVTVPPPTNIPEGAWSLDGKWLVVRTLGGDTRRFGERDILGMRPGVDTALVPLAANPRYDEAAPTLSPDGKWLAYESDETAQIEVYVRPFPNTDDGKWQVSVGGGQAPLWAHSGKELFYVDGARNMVVVPVMPGGSFRPGERRSLFRLGTDFYLGAQEHYTPFDITPDDQRFIMARMVRSAEERKPTFILVENWFTELKARMAAK